MHEITYHLLFVDDDEDFLLFIDTAISSRLAREQNTSNLKLHYMNDSLETLNLINELNEKNENIAVLVTDQRMPEMTGIELLEKIRATLPKTFKILLTAYGSLESAQYAINNKLLDQYYTKPITDPDNFASLICDALHAYHIRKKKEKAEEAVQNHIRELKENNQKIMLMHKAAEKIARLAQDFKRLDLDEVFTLITERLPDVFNAQNASLFILNKEDNNLNMVRSNFLSESFKKPMENQSKAPMMVALRENRILVIPDIKQTEKYTFLGKENLGESCVIIPFCIGKDENTTGDILGKQEEIKGVLNLGKIDSIESEEIVLYAASLIQNLLGINILNANLYKKTIRMAIVDGLTGLYNKQMFQEFFNREQQLSERNGTSFFLALFDIDNFKRINDTHGHLAGDEVLKMIGATFLKSARKSDIIARFGGEEFTWIIHSDSNEECFTGLERIRQEINTTVYPKDIKVSVSIGLAKYIPNNDDNIESVINRADFALYQAKSQGKNRTVMNIETDSA